MNGLEKPWTSKHRPIGCTRCCDDQLNSPGKPPSDERSSKEFPDAYVIEGLARYCKSDGITMYVVSGDAALRRTRFSQHPDSTTN